MKEELKKLLEEQGANMESEEVIQMLETAELHDLVLSKAKFLLALGTPIKPSAEFQRTVKKALLELHTAVANVEYGLGLDYKMTSEELEEAKDIAKKSGIRPAWLSKELN